MTVLPHRLAAPRRPAVAALAFAAAVLSLAPARAAPLPVKVVVVTAFEIGADTGDKAGELQLWVERLPLPETLPFPQGTRALRYDSERGVLAIVTGEGTALAAASIMGLGVDPRFDLTQAYWVVAGISGADPARLSLGSAAWAEWVVDADLGYEIDAREIPAGWTTGYVPLNRWRPFQPPPAAGESRGSVYRLDPALVRWALRATRDVHLEDSPALRRARSYFRRYHAARKPPHVTRGDSLSGMTFWHGTLMNDWARRWTRYWTSGRGTFATSAMEDTGTLTALTMLAAAGKVDRNRVLVLRTASNHTVPRTGETAAESLRRHADETQYTAFGPAIEAAYRVGSVVVRRLAAGDGPR